MKDVIEQYTKIIRDLETRNRELMLQNEEHYKYQ